MRGLRETYHHQIIDVVKHQRPARAIRFFRLQEMHRLLAPVAERVEVVGGVVAVVEAEAVALYSHQHDTVSKRARVDPVDVR